MKSVCSYFAISLASPDERTVIIEMQVLNVLGFEKRVLYNAAKAFSIQLSVGEDYTFEVAKQSKLSKKELELLEKREMFLHDNRNAILKARQEGRAEEEREKAIAIARSLLGLLDIETISQKTGIGIAEIQALL